MGGFIFNLNKEDIYCLGLIYSYRYANKKMVLKDDLDNFYKIIIYNLKDKNSTLTNYSITYSDDSFSIYFECEGKNNEVYCVLYPDFDLEKAISKYIEDSSLAILIASQRENALIV